MLPGNRPVQLEGRLAGLGLEGVHEDEGLHVWQAVGGDGYHGARVGVADEHDRSLHRPDLRGDVGGVPRETAQRVGDGHHGVAVAGKDRVTPFQLEASAKAP